MLKEDLIARAFFKVEETLIRSMVRNLARHKAREAAEGFEWEQWQSVQLRQLDAYRRKTVKTSRRAFERLNGLVADLLGERYRQAGEAEQKSALDASEGGWDAAQLGVPEHRLDALLGAVSHDLSKAEHAILRKAQDEYRDVIATASLYAQAGGTYAQAIDMATKDMLEKGLNAIRYRNGSMHTIGEYAQMAVRTAAKRAALVAEGAVRDSWGVHTVYVDYRDDACPECLEWVGVVLVDDVYSGGTRQEAEAGGYGLLSEAMEAGLFHPNCRDTLSTYFPGVSTPPSRPTAEEQAKSEIQEAAEQIRNNAIANARKYGRIADNSLDPTDKRKARAKEDEWAGRAEAV